MHPKEIKREQWIDWGPHGGLLFFCFLFFLLPLLPRTAFTLPRLEKVVFLDRNCCFFMLLVNWKNAPQGHDSFMLWKWYPILYSDPLKKTYTFVCPLPTVKSRAFVGVCLLNRQKIKSFPHVSCWRVWCRERVMKSVWMWTWWLQAGIDVSCLGCSNQREESFVSLFTPADAGCT